MKVSNNTLHTHADRMREILVGTNVKDSKEAKRNNLKLITSGLLELNLQAAFGLYEFQLKLKKFS